MRGLSAGDMPVSFEIVPKPEQTGTLSYPDAFGLSYENLPDDLTSNLQLDNNDTFALGAITDPTVPENHDLTEAEKDKYLDIKINELFEADARERKIDRLVSQILKDVTLNKEGFLVHSDTGEQNNIELILPSIQLDPPTADGEVPSTIQTVELSANIEAPAKSTIQGTEKLIHPVSETKTMTLPPAEKLLATITSIHESGAIAGEEPNEVQIAHTNTVENTQNTSNDNVADPTIWRPAFSYSFDQVSEKGGTFDEPYDKPILSPDGLLSRLAVKLRFISPAPSIEEKIIEPTLIQSELDMESKIIGTTPETVSEKTWTEKISDDDVFKSGNTPPEAIKIPTVNQKIDIIDYISQDEADVKKLLKETMEQFTEKKPEPKKQRFIEVPQISYEQVTSIAVDTIPARGSFIGGSRASKQEQPKNHLSTTKRTEQQRRKEINALKRLSSLSQAQPWEVAKVVASDTTSYSELNLVFQKLLNHYSNEYSIDTIWSMYCDLEIRADGTIMAAAQKQEFNELLIESLEFVDDTQFAFAA